MTKPDAAAQPWVAFFYSVVLEPQRRMKSVDLLEIARVARLARARTVLSTGNLIGWARGDERDLERRLERAAEAVVGKRIPVFCRSVPDFRRIVVSNPLDLQTTPHAGEVAVRVMRAVPPPDVIKRIASKAERGEHFGAHERTLWVAASGQLSESRLMRAVNAAWAGEGTTRSLSALGKIGAAIDSIRPRASFERGDQRVHQALRRGPVAVELGIEDGDLQSRGLRGGGRG